MSVESFKSVAKLFVRALTLVDVACSPLIWVVSLVLQVCERGEGASPQSVQLVLQEHDFLLLLLDDVQQLALVGNLCHLRLRIVGAVLVGVRLESHDLLPVVHIQLKLASLVIQLLVLKVFLSDVSTQLLLCHIEGLDALVSIRLQLLDLAL